MTSINRKEFEKEQEKLLEELEKTALLRAAIEIIQTPPKRIEDQKARDDMKRQYETNRDSVDAESEDVAQKVDAVARLMGSRGRLAFD